MSRYIDADKLQEDFKELHGGKRSLLIDTALTADVRKSVKGEWIKEIKHYKDDEQEYDYYDIYCSACGKKPEKAWHLTNYCPNCGADMRGGDAK